jgi:multicomponent K+:H+ antiporter subunit G
MLLLAELIVAIFVILAGIFGLAGSFGLVKLRDTMKRVHGPTKATTLGIGSALIASMLYFLLIEGQVSFHELLITLFMFLTAPITANFIAKTYILRNEAKDDLPPSATNYGWSVFDDPPSEKQRNDT